jgi:hypothetical protein
MGRPVLTRNIVLLTACMGSHCTAEGEISIEELRDFGEPECKECESFMMLTDNAIIKN